MRVYIQGLITGGMFVFSLMVLLGNQNIDNIKMEKNDEIKKVIVENPDNRKALKELGMDPEFGVGRYQIALSEANVIRMIDTRTADLYYWHNTKDSWQFMGEFK